MKIAVFIKRTTLHKGFGGLETQNKILCEGLVKKGHDVTVFSPRYEVNTSFIEENKVKYIFVESKYGADFGFASFNKKNWINRSVEEFAKIHSQQKFDIVIGQSSAGIGILRKIRIPVVSISHGSIMGEFTTQLQNLKSLKDYARIVLDFGYVLYNFFGRQREFVTHSKRVVAVSKFVKNSLIDETFVPEDRVEVIYNGIDPADFASGINPNKKSDDFNLVFVGRVHISKGLNDLFYAIRKALDSNLKDTKNSKKLKLTIVGTGEHAYLQYLKNLVRTLSLENHITFLGNKPHHEVKNILAQSTVFVLPSRRKEGFPMTLVEAMLMGLPVIGAKIGGIPEAVEDKITGLLYESGNIEELSRCILELLENSSLCNTMSGEAKRKALNEFTLDIMLNKYQTVLENVLHISNMKDKQ